jgi:hypothetical protein
MRRTCSGTASRCSPWPPANCSRRWLQPPKRQKQMKAARGSRDQPPPPATLHCLPPLRRPAPSPPPHPQPLALPPPQATPLLIIQYQTSLQTQQPNHPSIPPLAHPAAGARFHLPTAGKAQLLADEISLSCRPVDASRALITSTGAKLHRCPPQSQNPKRKVSSKSSLLLRQRQAASDQRKRAACGAQRSRFCRHTPPLEPRRRPPAKRKEDQKDASIHCNANWNRFSVLQGRNTKAARFCLEKLPAAGAVGR